MVFRKLLAICCCDVTNEETYEAAVVIEIMDNTCWFWFIWDSGRPNFFMNTGYISESLLIYYDYRLFQNHS